MNEQVYIQLNQIAKDAGLPFQFDYLALKINKELKSRFEINIKLAIEIQFVGLG